MDYVLITGATSGIGWELACLFAQAGYGLILASSHGGRLQETRDRLTARYAVPVHSYLQDLSLTEGAEALCARIGADGLEVEILVNNAGFGLVGPTQEIDLGQDQRLMVLNMITPVKLCKLLLPDMYRRGHGKILNIASIAAYQPGPYTATYFASKAFLLSYSKAVRYEARDNGVQVCALCPGSTKTEFFTREGLRTPGHAMGAKRVARYAYRKLMQNRGYAIPGVWNRMFCLLPDSFKFYGIAKTKAHRRWE